MAREASELTKAIRKLCQQTDFKITHSEARAHLKRLGFKIAPEPPEKSEAYKKWEAKRSGKYPKDPLKLAAYYRMTVRIAGLPFDSADAIMKEDAPHRAFNNERNNFDVTKWNYHRVVGSSNGHKPKVQRLTTVETKFVKTSNKEAVAALNWLLENGGAAAVEKKARALKAELQHLTEMLDKAASLHKLLPTAA